MKIFLLIFLVVAKASAQFENQYIGDFLSPEEVENRTYCESKYCLIDAQLLFYAATQNKSVGERLDHRSFVKNCQKS
jgi:hypothetical protein